MMTVLVIGFNAATRTEQMAARNYSYQEQANQMAMLAVNRGLELINSKIAGANAVTQPGQVFVPSSGTTPLSSAAFAASGASGTNINIWQEDKGNINYFISTNTDPAAFSAPLVVEKSGTNAIGQYAFWIDDDGSRLNLNAASSAGQSDFLPTNARPLVLSGNVFPAISTKNWKSITNAFIGRIHPADTSVTTNGWGYFFTPRQMSGLPGMTNATNYNTMMFQIAGGPLNWRPSNSYAFSSSGLPMAIDAGGTSGCLSIYDRRYLNSLDSLTTALDKFVDSNFKGAAFASYFGVSDGLLAKYGRNISRQIVANINDFALPTGAVAPGNKTSVTGAALNMLSPELIPTRVAGYRPFPFLNEIACQTYYATNEALGGAGTELQVQVWLGFEIANPFDQPWGDGSQIVVDVGDWKYQGSYKGTNGETVPFTNSAPASLKSNWKLQWAAQTNIPSQSYTNLFLVLSTSTNLPAPLTNAADISVTNDIRLKVVRYLQWRDANETIRDWAFGDDFESWTNSAMSNVAKVSATNGQILASDVPSYVNNGWKSATAVGVAKNDPRVKRYPDYPPPSRPWISVQGPAITLGSNNSTVGVGSGTGLPNVASDRITNADIMTLFGAESLGNTYPARPLSSAFDLSKVHTGLQWRTLQFRAQDASESTAVPDWALLEVFAVTNTTASGSPMAFKLNINSLAHPAASTMASSALLSGGLARPQAVAALLAGMTNAAGAAVGTTNLGFPAAAGFSTANDFLTNATNIASLKFTNTWAARRSANAAAYQTNLYTLPAEVLEINGVANFSTDEAANEARGQAVYTGVAVASQVFTIYAAGFATDKQGSSVAEARVRAQVARDTNTGKFKIVFLEPLIWP
jgi:hypothetical protein